MMHQVFLLEPTPWNHFSCGQTWSISFPFFWPSKQQSPGDSKWPFFIPKHWRSPTTKGSRFLHPKEVTIAELWGWWNLQVQGLPHEEMFSKFAGTDLDILGKNRPSNVSTLQWFGWYSGQPELNHPDFKMSSIYVSVSSVSFHISKNSHRNHLHLLGGKSFPLSKLLGSLRGARVLLGWHPLKTIHLFWGLVCPTRFTSFYCFITEWIVQKKTVVNLMKLTSI